MENGKRLLFRKDAHGTELMLAQAQFKAKFIYIYIYLQIYILKFWINTRGGVLL